MPHRTPPTHHETPCTDLVRLQEQVRALENLRTEIEEIPAMKARTVELQEWRVRTLEDLKEIREVVSQVKLLMALSIGGGGLSILTLIITIVDLVRLGFTR